MKAHCLFEQSGTFKNEFIKLGVDAEDYDIQNEFGQTDHVIDLFSHIRGGYIGEPSLFDVVKKDDLIMAFFPCTRFEAKVPLLFRGEAPQQKNWDMGKKLKYSMKLHKELSELYELISMLAYVCYERGLQAIIENPYTAPHYLTTYWCVKPAIIDKDRTERGDYYKKPTQYFFINREPRKNFIWEPQIVRDVFTIDRPEEAKKVFGDINRQTIRSMIAPEYANRFIREFILDVEEEKE